MLIMFCLLHLLIYSASFKFFFPYPPAPPFLVSAVTAVHFKLTYAFKIQIIGKTTIYITHNYNTFMDFYLAKGTIPLQLFWNSKAIYFRYVFTLKSKTS